jgi:hypothetical protein
VPSGEVVAVAQPTTLEARLALARRFVDEYGIDMDTFVDDPEQGEPFEKLYAPWPLRLYVLDAAGTVEWVAEPDKCSFDGAVQELCRRLGC